jgi:hypothetical protein
VTVLPENDTSSATVDVFLPLVIRN